MRERGERERGERERESGKRDGKRRDKIRNIMLLNNDSRANKIQSTILYHHFLLMKIFFSFTISKSYKYKFINLTYDFHF